MTRRSAVAWLAALFLLAGAPRADAQIIRTRPFEGIFRTTSDPEKSRTQVDFFTFLSGGFETTTATRESDLFPTVTNDSGFGNLVLRGRFAHRFERKTVGLEAGTTTSYYSGTGAMSPLSLYGSAHFDGTIGRRTIFAIRQVFSYSPYYVLAPFDTAEPQVAAAPTTDQTVTGLDPRVDMRAARFSNNTYSTYGGMEIPVSRRGTVFGSLSFFYTATPPAVSDVMGFVPRIGYRLQFARFVAFTARYENNRYEYRNSGYAPYVTNDVSVGITYDRPLSLQHRTSFGFQTGTAAAKSGDVLRLYLVGNAHVERWFGRTWVVGVGYLRNQRVMEGFDAPYGILGNSVSVFMSGHLSRDVQLGGSVAYTHGGYDVGTFANTFDTVTASARVQVPIIWFLAATGEVFYSDYDFQRRLGLLEGIPGAVHRLGTRVGVTFNLPVVR